MVDIKDANRVERARLYDTIRGLSVISMVLFHFCYDLKYIMGIDLPFFRPPTQDVWRCTISWTFILLAGMMCNYSRNNLKRSAKYLAVALLIFVVTSVAAVDTPISFGIIYCMGACTLTTAVLHRTGVRPPGWMGVVLLAAAFIVCLNLQEGIIGLGANALRLPRAPYEAGWLSWLGFPGPRFASGDYYPLLPYLFLYLSGWGAGAKVKESKTTSAVLSCGIGPLEVVGRRPLPIYVAHQPILLILADAIARFA